MNTPYAIPGFSDPFSSLSHLVGAFVFLGLSYPLIRSGRGDTWKLLALSIFSFACVFMLSMSGIYHLLAPESQAKTVLHRLDHSAIFILIVSTMTPIHQILFRGFMRWGWLVIIWTIAISSLTLKVVFFDSFPQWLGLTMFLSLGWLGIITGSIIAYKKGWGYVRLIVLGGIAYTAGAMLEFFNQPVLIHRIVGPHELFHVAVLLGLGLHWRFIYNIAQPKRND